MEKKYISILVGLILSILLYVVIFVLATISAGPGPNLIPNEYITEFVYILPGPLYTDILILYAVPILFYFVFYAVSPYIVPAYIKIHKFMYWLLRRPSKYGIFPLGAKIKSGRLFYRALIVSLFSFAISSLIVELGYGALFRPNLNPDMALNIAEAVFLGTFLLCSITIVLFFPIWLLEDSGLVSYRVFHGERMPADIQGVHSIYWNILLGYAGISTIISLVRYISTSIEEVGPTDPAILTPIIMLVLPFIVTGLLALPIILYEIFFDKNQAKLRKRLEKFNFPTIEIPTFEEMEV